LKKRLTRTVKSKTIRKKEAREKGVAQLFLSTRSAPCRGVGGWGAGDEVSRLEVD